MNTMRRIKKFINDPSNHPIPYRPSGQKVKLPKFLRKWFPKNRQSISSSCSGRSSLTMPSTISSPYSVSTSISSPSSLVDYRKTQSLPNFYKIEEKEEKKTIQRSKSGGSISLRSATLKTSDSSETLKPSTPQKERSIRSCEYSNNPSTFETTNPAVVDYSDLDAPNQAVKKTSNANKNSKLEIDENIENRKIYKFLQNIELMKKSDSVQDYKERQKKFNELEIHGTKQIVEENYIKIDEESKASGKESDSNQDHEENALITEKIKENVNKKRQKNFNALDKDETIIIEIEEKENKNSLSDEQKNKDEKDYLAFESDKEKSEVLQEKEKIFSGTIPEIKHFLSTAFSTTNWMIVSLFVKIMSVEKMIFSKNFLNLNQAVLTYTIICSILTNDIQSDVELDVGKIINKCFDTDIKRLDDLEFYNEFESIKDELLEFKEKSVEFLSQHFSDMIIPLYKH